MKEYLTNRQIAFIVFGIIVGYGIMPLTKDIVENAGTGGWFALILAVAIGMIFTYIFTYLGYVYEDKTIYEYSKLLTGKYITFIFMSIFIIYYFTAFTMVTRIASETIRLTILLKTPVWALNLIFLIFAYYAVIKKLRVIARVCELFGVIIIIAFLITVFSLFSKGDMINLKPFFVLDDIKTYFKAIPVTITPLLGMELISIIPFNRKINNKKIFNYTVLIVGFIGILYILEVEACLSIMGDSVIYYKAALLAAIQRTEIPAFQFFSRLDGLFIIFWIMALFCTIIVWAYGAVYLIHKYFKRIHFNLVAFIVFFLSFVIARLVQTTKQAEQLYTYVGYIGFVAAGIIPVILLIITKIKKYDKDV